MSCSLPGNNGSLSGACPADVSPARIHCAILDWMANVLLLPQESWQPPALASPDSALGLSQSSILSGLTLNLCFSQKKLIQLNIAFSTQSFTAIAPSLVQL